MDAAMVYDKKGTPVGTLNRAIFQVVATGAWQDINIPGDMECKSLLIMAHNDDETLFVRDPVEFHMKSSPDSTSWVPLTQLALQTVIDAGGYIGTFKAEVGNAIVFIVLW